MCCCGYCRVRIGIVLNNENDCLMCDFRIGFGIGGYLDNFMMCGNVVKYSGDNGERYIKIMGYILVY